ncbi:methyltransferase domain-containing protein [Microcoleus sp. AT9_B5]
MSDSKSDLLDNIRQQFDNKPYPDIPLDLSPKTDYQSLYIHNLATSYYLRNQKVIDTKGKVILDAGCGSGYTSLVLAEANPGAKIVGVDISEESVKVARQRLQYHGFENTDFYAISLENLSNLSLEFDCINNDEVLYLLPDINEGLSAMKAVLKPDGILRTNLHNSSQRVGFFRGQKIFEILGVNGQNRNAAVELVRETMAALKDNVLLKARNWNSDIAGCDQRIMSNYLLLGDKGYTISETFAALRAADLEFISMVKWRQWELIDLFRDPDNLIPFLEISLPEISVEERLYIFELLHPIHRLIDFWCGHPNQSQSFLPVGEWTLLDWQNARVHLHPQLNNSQVKADSIECINEHKPFEISCYVPLPTLQPIFIESHVAACLLPLWEGVQSVDSLTQRWLQLNPFHPATLEPISHETAFDEVKKILTQLESFLYILLEQPE